MNIDALDKIVHEDLAKIDYGTADWCKPLMHEGQNVLDVAIIGGGQGGLAASFALRRRGLSNHCIFDSAARGEEGPWVTFARMITLRTPKYVTGPDCGIPSLTPRSWFEARYSKADWESLDKISREDWQAYLDWFRDILALPVQNNHKLTDIDWEEGLLKLTFATEEGEKTLWARRIVLATGIEGGGAWHIPDFISDSLPESRYAHTSEQIDFAALKGKRIGVLGAGASAFDNAATALEQGVASVDLCFRRKQIPTVNPYRWMENAGFLSYFSDLPDLTRWRFMRKIYDLNQPPPQNTFWRCRQHANFAFHAATPWLSVREEDGNVIVTTPQGEMTFDFLIIGTGFTVDLSRRPELSRVASHIALWKDRFEAPEGEENNLLSSHPYLSRAFQYQPRDVDDPLAPMLSCIYDFNFSAMPSMGLSGSSISGMRFGVEKLSYVLGQSLFVEDGQRHLRSLLDYHVDELTSFDPPVTSFRAM